MTRAVSASASTPVCCIAAAAAALAFASLASTACMGKRACPVPPESTAAPDESAAAKPAPDPVAVTDESQR